MCSFISAVIALATPHDKDLNVQVDFNGNITALRGNHGCVIETMQQILCKSTCLNVTHLNNLHLTFCYEWSRESSPFVDVSPT